MKMSTDISKKCTQCGKSVWPSLATAIIVLIRRGEEVLLVQARNFKSDFYGLVAGFVETGETLEQAVHREVMEETGVVLGEITYHSSQPWPFPSSLMLGFHARAASTTIIRRDAELEDAQWFSRANIASGHPRVGARTSISWRVSRTA